MGVAYTREAVHDWLMDFYRQSSETDLRTWLVDKLGDDAQTTVRRQVNDTVVEVPLIDVILDDVPSYSLDFRDAD